MAEAAIAIAYPEPWNRGKALGYWLTYRLSGQILGGAINLGLNADRNEAGKVSYTVFLVFIALQAAGPLVGLLLSRPSKVERRDGKRVDLSVTQNPWFEIRETTRLFFSKRFLLIVLFIGQAVFAEAVFFTYLASESPSSLFPHNPDLKSKKKHQCGSQSVPELSAPLFLASSPSYLATSSASVHPKGLQHITKYLTLLTVTSSGSTGLRSP